jgi:hypothetical protein
MLCPAACCTFTLPLSWNSVSPGANGEQVTVTGTVTDTRPKRLGSPSVTVIPSALAAVTPQTAITMANNKSLRNMIHLQN